MQLRPGEVQVVGGIDGHKVHVCMRHLETNNAEPAAVAGEGFFNGFGNRFSEYQPFAKQLITEVEAFIYLYFGYYQNVALNHWRYIQESEELLVFSNLEGRNLPADDTSENAAHD